MESKSLLYGLIGFFLGGLIVSLAATTFNTPTNESKTGMTMDQMTDTLQAKRGEAFDKAFITEMISHHQGAIDMATLADKNDAHDEIKKMSKEIIAVQNTEIRQMERWQEEWGFHSEEDSQVPHSRH